MIKTPAMLKWMAQERERIHAKAWAKGYAEGVLEARREDLRSLLEKRFGPLPEAIRQQIEATTDAGRLHAAVLQVSNLQALADFRL